MIFLIPYLAFTLLIDNTHQSYQIKNLQINSTMIQLYPQSNLIKFYSSSLIVCTNLLMNLKENDFMLFA
jgi:hypothetical protein